MSISWDKRQRMLLKVGEVDRTLRRTMRNKVRPRREVLASRLEIAIHLGATAESGCAISEPQALWNAVIGRHDRFTALIFTRDVPRKATSPGPRKAAKRPGYRRSPKDASHHLCLSRVASASSPIGTAWFAEPADLYQGGQISYRGTRRRQFSISVGRRDFRMSSRSATQTPIGSNW